MALPPIRQDARHYPRRAPDTTPPRGIITGIERTRSARWTLRTSGFSPQHLAKVTASPSDLGGRPPPGMPVRRVLEWPFAPHAGIRSVTVHSATRNSEPYTRMVLTASFGGDLTGIELSVGLDLDLPPQDTAQVFGASEHLIGRLVAPESAPATKHTVQLDFRE